MDSVVDQVDDRTFKVNFSGEGADKLKERVNVKLKEFMGDYTDDTLVEYVIVLLRNGKTKEEAKNELNVFLGDDSDSFVSWLWDHLAANLSAYVQPQEYNVEQTIKTKSTLGSKAGNNGSHQFDSVSEKKIPPKVVKSRHNREWNGLVKDAAEPPPLISSEINSICVENKTGRNVRHDRKSPSRSDQRKRSRLDDRQHVQRETTGGAPRRLLQFAVREAVATSKPSDLTKEPSFKRLRSVVSTSHGDLPSSDPPRRIQPVARVFNPMATVMKAVAEAAEDVKKAKPVGSVFDRLGRGTGVSETINQLAEFREAEGKDEECSDLIEFNEQTRRGDFSRQYTGNMRILGSRTELLSDSLSDTEDYDDINVIGHRGLGVPLSRSLGASKDEDLMMVQYNVDDVSRSPQIKDREEHLGLNVNANSWIPPNHQESRKVIDMDRQKSFLESKFSAQSVKMNSNHVTVGNGNVKSATSIQKESPNTPLSNPGSYTAGRPLEDADSRTIFVSNVHFAASKDSLSRHFNKFGEVLKVVIVTDAATGQPKGSAYVEFMRKEAAENALSLDGTSFMSRILKIVKRSSAQPEPAAMMAWPRSTRGSTFTGARFGRASYSRGNPRSHLPGRSGGRSFQWKRDAQAPPPTESGASGSLNNVVTPTPTPTPTPTSRSLTYVRTEAKPNGNSSAA